MVKKLVLLFLSILVVSGVLFGTYFGIRYVFPSLIRKSGLVTDRIPISGTGSMYPTFPLGNGSTLEDKRKETVAIESMTPYPTGIDFFGKRLFEYNIGYGDIVTFSNDKTREITQQLYGKESGYIKRIIGLPNDVVEIRNGLVYLNNKPLKEPYTAIPHSTFGGSTIAECQKITIPSGKLFVLGDNRKVSADSRYDLGLISYKDIDHVLPFKSQIGELDKNWRDPSNDLNDSTKIKLSVTDFISKINEKRIENGVGVLKLEPKLNYSALKRSSAIMKFNDFSFEATISKYNMKKAMLDSGYDNVVWGEIPVQGYYTADELIQNLFEFPQSKKFVLNKDFQDIGITALEGEIDNCPTQVITIHFAGYVPPNYSKGVVDSWNALLQTLKSIQPSWKEVKEYDFFYDEHKKDIDRILEIISYRISKLTPIVQKLNNNQWLSDSETNYLKEDESLGKEEENLAKKINSQ